MKRIHTFSYLKRARMVRSGVGVYGLELRSIFEIKVDSFMNQLGWNRGVIFRPLRGIIDDSFLFLSNDFHHFALLHFVFNSCDVPAYASEYKNSCA